MRPDWDTYFLMIAYVTSLRATCDRKQVGAVIVDKDHRIVSGGYNGAPSKMPECDEVGHELKEIDGRMSCVRTLHAESNAIDRARQDLTGCTLYATVIPCYDCAKRIVSAGITRVVYSEYYESRNTKLVAEFFRKLVPSRIERPLIGREMRPAVELVHMPRTYEVKLVCQFDPCDNAARYDSGYCGLHDGSENAGRGKRL